jgi:hypothetical protein
MSPLDHYANRAAIRARRLRVIEQRMHVAPEWQAPHLVACWLVECGR